jgi:ABC-type Zn2+ transport system substrate-binding protein/surface adhesin
MFDICFYAEQHELMGKPMSTIAVFNEAALPQLTPILTKKYCTAPPHAHAHTHAHTRTRTRTRTHKHAHTRTHRTHTHAPQP